MKITVGTTVDIVIFVFAVLFNMDLLELSTTVSESAHVISGILEKNQINLSLDPQCPDPSSLAFPNAEAFHHARVRLRDAALQLVDLLSGKHEACRSIQYNVRWL